MPHPCQRRANATNAATHNVAVEAADETSVLALYRPLLALRRSSKALRRGRSMILPIEGRESFLVALNFGEQPVRVSAPGFAAGTIDFR